MIQSRTTEWRLEESDYRIRLRNGRWATFCPCSEYKFSLERLPPPDENKHDRDPKTPPGEEAQNQQSQAGLKRCPKCGELQQRLSNGSWATFCERCGIEYEVAMPQMWCIVSSMVVGLLFAVARHINFSPKISNF